MTARKLSFTLLFALCLSLCFTATGCGLLSSDEPSQQTTQSNGMSADDAKKAISTWKAKLVSEEDLADAKRDADDAQKKAAKLKEEADNNRRQTLARGKNPDDKVDAPTTYESIQKSNSADNDARQKQKKYDDLVAQNKQASDELRKANDALNNAQNQGTTVPNSTTVPPVPTPHKGDTMDSIVALLPTVLAALTALVILVVLFWWTWEKIKGVEAKTDGLIRDLASRQSNKFQELNAAVSGVKELNGRLSTIQDGIFRLGQALETLRKEQTLKNRLAETYNTTPPVTTGYAPPPADDGYPTNTIDFPIAANNFLSRMDGPQQIIKQDPLKNILVKDPEGKGQLVLVRDGSVPGGQLYIVPRITRFQAMQDFYNHYEQFYDCNHPGAGEVWVNEPAVVYGVDGGWQLRDKGILEVKS